MRPSRFLLLLLSLPCFGVDETQFVLTLRETIASGAGAATETKQALVAKFRNDTYLRDVTVNSATVTGFWEGTLMDSCVSDGAHSVAETGFREMWLGTFRLFEQTVDTSLPRSYGRAACDTVASIAGRAGLDLNYRVLGAEKSYQTLKVTYAVAFPLRELNDIRVGQKISFTAKVTGFTDTTAWLVAQHIQPESGTLKCAQGHEYAPSAGYKFCPIDGTPLK
jgi:hypothetical protein